MSTQMRYATLTSEVRQQKRASSGKTALQQQVIVFARAQRAIVLRRASGPRCDDKGRLGW